VSPSPPLLLHRRSPTEIEKRQNNSRLLNLLGEMMQ
jgi:hypothetical protein